MNNFKQVTRFVVLLVILSVQTTYAAPAVDAGSIQRDIQQLNRSNQPTAVPPIETENTNATSSGEVKVLVTAFHFVGAHLLSQAELKAEMRPFLNQTLDYNDLNKATKAISQLYQNKGWLAKVFLPPQELQNGTVTIEINEAKLGEVRLQTAASARLKPQYASKVLENGQHKGEPLSSKALERAMLIINDTPGFAGQATLSPGAQTGETDVTLNLADRPIFNAKIWADNNGSRLIGKARLNGLVSFNDLTGWGDRLTMQALVSSGLEFVQGGFEFPIGYSGTRVNLGGAVSNYQVNGAGFAQLNANGESTHMRLGMQHPIVRSRNENLTFRASIEDMNAKDNALGLQIANKDYRTLTLGLNGDYSDNLGQGGMFWGGASFTTGHLDLSGNRGDLAADQLSARTDGHYNKLNFYVGRQQMLADKLTAKVLFSAQLADKNLGGFEKFSLGGPMGVSGFTVGEAAADQGWMLNLEGRHGINQYLSASIMADAGGVCLYKNTWVGWNAGNSNLHNCYQLASAGLGINFTNQYVDAKLSYARQLSGNRGLDANGKDSEGESNKNQLWLQISTGF
ncbi:MAG: ShlB/FhaC/HecB family hemolysin secretion/activation protein [Methylotenera sp.]